jgi:uncharacterized protein (UPF0335 family)
MGHTDDIATLEQEARQMRARMERLESENAVLMEQAQALHKVAHILGFEAGIDVVMAPIGVRIIQSRHDSMEQELQHMTAERDDWLTYAKEAGAQKVRTALENTELKRTADFNFEQYQDAGRLLHDVSEQRDQLLAALYQIANESTRNLGSARIVARAAIAAVEQPASCAASVESEGDRYERLERKYMGDPEKQTGIYAPKPAATAQVEPEGCSDSAVDCGECPKTDGCIGLCMKGGTPC